MPTTTALISIPHGDSGKGPDGDGSLAYELQRADGPVVVTQTNAGLVERPAGSGNYEAAIACDLAWGAVWVRWYDFGSEIDWIKQTIDLAGLAAIDATPTAASNAAAVRTNLAAELARLDATISSRATSVQAAGLQTSINTLLGQEPGDVQIVEQSVVIS